MKVWHTLWFFSSWSWSLLNIIRHTIEIKSVSNDSEKLLFRQATSRETLELNHCVQVNPVADARFFSSNVHSWAWAIAANRRSEADETSMNSTTDHSCATVTIAAVDSILDNSAEHSEKDKIIEFLEILTHLSSLTLSWFHSRTLNIAGCSWCP